MKRIPSIRFDDFDNEWESHKFSEIFSILQNCTLSRAELSYEDGLALNVHYGDILTHFDEVLDVETAVLPRIPDEKVVFKFKQSTLRNGDIVIADTAEDETVGACVEIINSEGKTLISGLHTIPARPNQKFALGYLGYYMNSPSYHNQLFPLMQGTKVTSLSKSALQATGINFPSAWREQAAISLHFTELDNLIDTQQSKCAQMGSVVLSMREKLFAKPEQPFPENRFAGFSNTWRWRKLGEIAEKVTEKNTDSSIRETFTNSAEFGVISQRNYFDHDITNTDNIGGYYIVRPQDFVYNPRISTIAPVGPINRNRLGRNGVVSPLYTVFRTHDIDTVFLEWYFKCSYWHQYMYYNGNTGARFDRFSISDEVFFEMPIPWPTIEEQQKIGQFLEDVHSLVILYRQRLEKLKNIKAACLEGMFV